MSLSDDVLQSLQLILPFGYQSATFFCVSPHENPRVLGSAKALQREKESLSSVEIKFSLSDSAWGILALEPGARATPWDEILKHRPALPILFKQLLKNHRLENEIHQKKLFFSVLSHEIKTPLSATLPLIEFLSKKVEEESRNLEKPDPLSTKCAATLKRIQSLTKKVLGIVHQYLDQQSDLETSIPLLIQQHDLAALVQNAVEQIRDTDPHSQNHTWSVHVPQKLIAPIDALHFEAVVTNLLSNAMKYAPGASIEVVLSQTDKKIQLRISDSGPGIPPQDLPHLFHPFQRGAQTGTSTPGHGLGLFWVRQILRAHQGDIWLDTEHSTSGCRWICELPLNTP